MNSFHFNSGLDWKLLPIKEQELFEKNSIPLKLTKRKILFRQGSSANGIYIVKKGKLKVYQLNYDGSIQILFIYAEGEIFGYRPILSNEYQPVSVAAIEDCELSFIERNYFLEFLKKSISLSNLLLVSLSHEFTVMTNRLNVFAQRGIKERLALALLILNEKFKNEGDLNDYTEIKLSRIDLANYVGISLENLVRTLNYFNEKHLIRKQGKSIIILNPENLFLLSTID